MFTYNDRDLHRMPTPSKTHLPIKQFIIDSRILDDYAPADHEVILLKHVLGREAFSLAPFRPTLPFCACLRQHCAAHLLEHTSSLPV